MRSGGDPDAAIVRSALNASVYAHDAVRETAISPFPDIPSHIRKTQCVFTKRTYGAQA